MSEATLKDVMLAAFADGPVRLVVDTRCPGVVVPAAFEGCPNIKLNFSPKFAPHDLEVTDSEVKQTLSYNGERHHTTVPWSAVCAFQLASGQVGWVTENMPPEVLERLVAAVFGHIEWEPPTKRPTLRVVQ